MLRAIHRYRPYWAIVRIRVSVPYVCMYTRLTGRQKAGSSSTAARRGAAWGTSGCLWVLLALLSTVVATGAGRRAGIHQILSPTILADWRLRVQRATAGETGRLQNPQTTGSKVRTQCAVSCSDRAKDSVQRPHPPLRRDRAGPRPPPSLPSPSSPELPPSTALPKEPIRRAAAGAPPPGAVSHARDGAGPRTSQTRPQRVNGPESPRPTQTPPGRAKSRA